jgi:hypothetical protein
MFCCGDVAVVTVPVPSPSALRLRPTVIFTEEREDPIAPEKKQDIPQKVPEPKLDLDKKVDIDEHVVVKKIEKNVDITTVMDPTSVKDIKIRIQRMPALPRSPRRLCMRLQKIHSF